MNDYPALASFFAAYFHQDWQAEHATPGAVAAYYMDNESGGDVSRVRKEIGRLLAQDLDDDALAAQVRTLGSEYDPVASGGSYRAWLRELADRFSR